MTLNSPFSKIDWRLCQPSIKFALEDTGVFCFMYLLGNTKRKDCDIFYLKGIASRKKIAKGNKNDKDALAY